MKRWLTPITSVAPQIPAMKPDQNMHKMVIMPGEHIYNGNICIEFINISGGKLWMVLDNQRDYGRSFLNGRCVEGEWVIAVGVPKGI